MKTMGRKKSHKLLLEDIEPTCSTQGGGKKTSQVSTFDTSASHQDLLVSNCYHFRVSLEWGEMKIIANITRLTDESDYFICLKCIVKY